VTPAHRQGRASHHNPIKAFISTTMTVSKRSDLLTLTAVCLVLVAIGVTARLLPHPPSLAPMAAIALFSGYLLPRGALAIALVTGAMLISDAVIGFYPGELMIAVYLGLLFPVVFRGWLRRRLTVLRVGAAAIGGSVFFFLTSNFAVWAHSGWYPADLPGLVACYLAALPFFQYTLVGDLLWSGVFFGTYALVTRGFPPVLGARAT
jgi:hypothetical protein